MYKKMYKLLMVVVLSAVTLRVCAGNQKFPTGKLISYSFIRGGGMNPLDFTVYEIRRENAAGNGQLTVSGPCEGELITMDVGDEVFNHCLTLIRQHHLERSKGYYKSKFELLDAPSSSFSITFTDPYDNINGSGDMPDFIWQAINDIHRYLTSVVGDRKPEGHVDRIYGAEGVAGMHWTDGVKTYTTAEESMKELKWALRGKDDGVHGSEPDGMGFSRFHDGDQHYVLIHDYKNHVCRLFFSYDGNKDSWKRIVRQQQARAGKSNELSKMVNECFLFRPVIERLTLKQLEQLLDSIPMRTGEHYGHFASYTDIGGVNRELLASEIALRNGSEK